MVRTQATDTSEDVDRMLMKRYRSMEPAEKVRIVRQLVRMSQELALAGLRQRHPGAGERELELRLAAMRLPASVMRDVFGWPADDR